MEKNRRVLVIEVGYNQWIFGNSQGVPLVVPLQKTR